MATLSGTFDGTGVVPTQLVLAGAGVDTFLVVTNNGPNNINVTLMPGPTFDIHNACSQAFFLTSGTAVHLDGSGCTAFWELVVPG